MNGPRPHAPDSLAFVKLASNLPVAGAVGLVPALLGGLRRRHLSVPPLALTALLLLAPGGYASIQDRDGGETAIHELIQEIHSRIAGLAVDGGDDDWEGIPVLGEPAEPQVEDPTRDLISTAIVPSSSDLWILLRTAGRPSREDRAFWLNLDLVGDRRPELQIGISSGGSHHVRLFDGYRAGSTFRSRAPSVTVGDVVEIRIPLDSLEAMLNGVADLRGSGARSWIRAFPLSWDAETGEFVDFGPAAASFRILSEAYPLDPPLPERESPAATLPLPLEGIWWVAQGAFSYSSHTQIWAYDLAAVNEALQWSTDPQGCRLEDSFSWNRQVWSPAGGRVLRLVTDARDNPPCRNGEGDPNSVYLDLGGGVGLWLAHFKLGSLVVERRNRVTQGQYLGRVGNSGASSGPHLHLGLYDTRDGETTLPLAFRDVRVGLNPAEDDPWAREMEVWEPREGFFVTALEDPRR